jgi:hypothetical protein
MARPLPTHGELHAAILEHVIAHGVAPEADALASRVGVSGEGMVTALHALAEYHGVVLHPHAPRIWVVHPFSLAPTGFLLRAGDREWWGNCAWCSLGAAALLDRDVTITTTLGANGRQVDVRIRGGRLVDTGHVVHFPVPMAQAWDNVLYTCSTMLLFEGEGQVDDWSRRHGIPRGDVQPIEKIWEFARAWYGNHLSPTWTKWTVEEARALFERFGLTGPVWRLPGAAGRF